MLNIRWQMMGRRALAVALFGGGLLPTGLLSPAVGDEEKPIEAAAVQLGRPVEFERDIYPILEANCIACHNVALSESDLILENAAGIMKGGSAGPSVVAGKPEESLLFKVAARTEEPVMPPWPNDVQAKKLTPEQLGLLRQWILEGAAAGASGKSAAMKWQPINSQLKAVYSVDIDPYGRFVAAGRGGLVTIYDLAAREHTAQLVDAALQQPAADGAAVPPASHRDYVHAVAFHPSGNLLASSGYREVKLWKRTVDRASSRAALPAEATQWCGTADGATLLVATAAPGLTILDARSGEQRAQLETAGQAVTAITLLGGEKPAVAAALADGRVQVNDLASGELRHRTEPLASPIAAFSGELTGSRLAGLCGDGVVRLLTVAADTGAVAVAAEIKSEAGAIQKVSGHGAALLTVTGQKAEVWKSDDAGRLAAMDLPAAIVDQTLHLDADRAVFVLQDGQSLLWAVREPKQVAVLNQDLVQVRSVKHAETLKAIRDARTVFLKSKVDETEKELTAQKEAAAKAKTELEQAMTAAAEARKKLDEAVAATAAARKASEEKPDDEALKKAVEPAEKAETAAKDASTAADNKQQLAQKSSDFAAAAVVRAEQRVVERKQQQMAAQQEAEAAAAALETTKAAAAAAVVQSRFCQLAAGGAVVVTEDAAGAVRLWKAADGLPLDLLPAVEGVADIGEARLAGDTLQLVAAGHLVQRPLFPGWELDAVLGPADGSTDPQAESVFVDRVLSLAFSPDGTLLAAGGGEASRQGQLTLWSVADRKLVRQFPDAHSDTVYGLEFSPDGRLLASASADKFAKVFEVESGKHVQSYEGHTHHVMDITWKADSTLLASAGADNAIKVWNAETGEQTRTIATYTKQVTSLSFVGLQDQMLSSSGDKRVFLHNASNGSAVREFAGNPDYVYRAAATPDGSIVTAGCEDGILRVWNGADGKEIVSFKP